jgi:threonine aldolase
MLMRFDTVYISLYRYLGAPFGAILAGDTSMMKRAREGRHVYDGMIYHGWVAALPAIERLDGFTDRFARRKESGNHCSAASKELAASKFAE